MGPILSTERPGNDDLIDLGVIDDNRVDVEDDDDDNIQADDHMVMGRTLSKGRFDDLCQPIDN